MVVHARIWDDLLRTTVHVENRRCRSTSPLSSAISMLVAEASKQGWLDGPSPLLRVVTEFPDGAVDECLLPGEVGRDVDLNIAANLGVYDDAYAEFLRPRLSTHRGVRPVAVVLLLRMGGEFFYVAPAAGLSEVVPVNGGDLGAYLRTRIGQAWDCEPNSIDLRLEARTDDGN